MITIFIIILLLVIFLILKHNYIDYNRKFLIVLLLAFLPLVIIESHETQLNGQSYRLTDNYKIDTTNTKYEPLFVKKNNENKYEIFYYTGKERKYLQSVKASKVFVNDIDNTQNSYIVIKKYKPVFPFTLNDMFNNKTTADLYVNTDISFDGQEIK